MKGGKAERQRLFCLLQCVSQRYSEGTAPFHFPFSLAAFSPPLRGTSLTTIGCRLSSQTPLGGQEAAATASAQKAAPHGRPAVRCTALPWRAAPHGRPAVRCTALPYITPRRGSTTSLPSWRAVSSTYRSSRRTGRRRRKGRRGGTRAGRDVKGVAEDVVRLGTIGVEGAGEGAWAWGRQQGTGLRHRR